MHELDLEVGVFFAFHLVGNELGRLLVLVLGHKFVGPTVDVREELLEVVVSLVVEVVVALVNRLDHFLQVVVISLQDLVLGDEAEVLAVLLALEEVELVLVGLALLDFLQFLPRLV